MKRFQVLKLFNPKYVSKNTGWKDIEKEKPSHDCIIMAKLSNGDEVKSMYFTDGCAWAYKYTNENLRFWDYKTEEPLTEVTHWNEEF